MGSIGENSQISFVPQITLKCLMKFYKNLVSRYRGDNFKVFLKFFSLLLVGMATRILMKSKVHSVSFVSLKETASYID